MRIAIFHELPPGGARKVANELALNLKKNHEVDLFYIDSRKNNEEKKYYSKTYFFKFEEKKWSGGNWKVKLYKDTFELLKLYFFHRKVASDINKKNYDLVIVHPSKVTQSPFLLRFIKSKKIYYAEEVYRIMYEPVFRFRKSEYPLKYIYETFSKNIKKTIDRGNAGKAKNVFVSSRHTKNGFKKYYGIDATLVYPGIDTKYFSPKKMKKDIDLLFIGSIDFETDEYTFFKSSVQFVKKDLKIKALGGGNEWLTDDEILEFYRRSKLVICTSRNEPLGLVPLEAASCGTPALAINSGGYKETIKDKKTGYLIKRDPIYFSQIIEKVIDDEKILDKFGKNAREYVISEWDWKNRIRLFEDLFSKYSETA